MHLFIIIMSSYGGLCFIMFAHSLFCDMKLHSCASSPAAAFRSMSNFTNIYRYRPSRVLSVIAEIAAWEIFASLMKPVPDQTVRCSQSDPGRSSICEVFFRVNSVCGALLLCSHASVCVL